MAREAECTTFSVTFGPGEMGIDADWELGRVTRVYSGGQAERHGLKVGMVFKSIDSTIYDENLLDEKIEGNMDYEVTLDLRDQCFCRRRIQGRYCCLRCGPVIARWKCWSMCCIISYILACPLIFFAMHFLQYPGNFEGDFHIKGATRSNYVASRSDGKHMQGMKLPITSVNNSKQAPVIFFGGNGQGMSGAARDAEMLLINIMTATNAFQFQAFTTAYRGYAPNSGWVTQAGLTTDAMDFLDHALNSTHGSQDGRVLLAGWSMGAGVAMQLAAARPDKIAGLIVFSPWSTLRTESLNIAGGLGHLIWPWIWLSEIWDSVAAVSSLPADIPVAVISAGHDLVIPNWEHRRVFEASQASHKWWIPTPGAGHGDLNLEVSQNIDQVSQWMQASWERVQVFGKCKGNGTSDPHLEVASSWPGLLGDALAQLPITFMT